MTLNINPILAYLLDLQLLNLTHFFDNLNICFFLFLLEPRDLEFPQIDSNKFAQFL